MSEEKSTTAVTPFERIKWTNPDGNEFWSSRDFAGVLGYTDYRNFESVIEKARTACFNSGQRVEDWRGSRLKRRRKRKRVRVRRERSIDRTYE